MAVKGLIDEIAHRYVADFRLDIRYYGPLRATLLHTILQDTLPILTAIQKNVVDLHSNAPGESSKRAFAIKESYATTFTMVGVAGAIFAQLATLGFTVRDVSISWTVQAALVLSTASAVLSVYFACLVQNKMNRILDHETAKQWLTAPRAYPGLTPNRTPASTIPGGQQTVNAEPDRMPSFTSALLLDMPSHLLTWALASYLVASGIYIGLSYTKHPSGGLSPGQSLAILLVFVIFIAAVLLLYLLLTLGKVLEDIESADRDLKKKVSGSSARDAQPDGSGAFRHLSIPSQSSSRSSIYPMQAVSRTTTDETTGAPDSRSKAAVPLPGQTSAAKGSQRLEVNSIVVEAMVASLQHSISAHQASIKAEEDLLRCLGKS